jgi:hypothetical protein
MMSLEQKGAIPFQLVDSEEIDKMLITADSLLQKVAILDEYKEL